MYVLFRNHSKLILLQAYNNIYLNEINMYIFTVMAVLSLHFWFVNATRIGSSGAIDLSILPLT